MSFFVYFQTVMKDLAAGCGTVSRAGVEKKRLIFNLYVYID